VPILRVHPSVGVPAPPLAPVYQAGGRGQGCCRQIGKMGALLFEAEAPQPTSEVRDSALTPSGVHDRRN
jgi:hypothetical protein